MEQPKCLIVDDFKENLSELKSLLKGENLNIILANSGSEALKLLPKHDFALALIDVQMPKMDGFELAEIMRSTERTHNIPLILITDAQTDSGRVFQGYEAGAVDFLQRPLTPQIVISKVRIFIELFLQKQKLEQKLKKIEETEAYLQKALKSRDEFLSICSHELKTPLTTLKMQIQITNRMKEKKGAKQTFSEENMTKFLKQADQSVDRIVRLVNDMLDISRVSTGKLSLNLEQVHLDKVIFEVADRLSTFMNFANCPVNITTDDHVVGQWDRFRLEQVITNLFTNAVKYAPEKPVDVIILKKNHKAILKVIDHGEGISEENIKLVFERFARAVTSTSVSGLGLGLYISKQIVELHNGTIEVDSIVGKGTTFTITLPIA